MTTDPFRQLLSTVAASLRARDPLANVSATAEHLEFPAVEAATKAAYRLFAENGRLYVALLTPDRWLSQSIEQDLVHTGDKLSELLDEELAEVGYTGPSLPFEHFRSEDKLFTFRSPLPIKPEDWSSDRAAGIATQCLLAYHACFLRLGDMNNAEDDE